MNSKITDSDEKEDLPEVGLVPASFCSVLDLVTSQFSCTVSRRCEGDKELALLHAFFTNPIAFKMSCCVSSLTAATFPTIKKILKWQMMPSLFFHLLSSTHFLEVLLSWPFHQFSPIKTTICRCVYISYVDKPNKKTFVSKSSFFFAALCLSPFFVHLFFSAECFFFQCWQSAFWYVGFLC